MWGSAVERLRPADEGYSSPLPYRAWRRETPRTASATRGAPQPAAAGSLADRLLRSARLPRASGRRNGAPVRAARRSLWTAAAVFDGPRARRGGLTFGSR